MLILHTADWHLGAQLANRRRTTEQQAFLDWLFHCAAQERANVLIVAGDIFDTTTPPHSAQEQYFHFLSQIIRLPDLRHVVIVAGNHDSTALLDAPSTMLSNLNIHVIGAAKTQIEDEILCLNNTGGELELIVCAVPYLRERDVRFGEMGENQNDKNQKVIQGTAQHYATVFQAAQTLRGQRNIPIIGTGHLFATASGRESETGEGVRELYVGTLNRFPAECFPPFDYLALGHLHIAQQLNTVHPICYSGSPLHMGFGEIGQTKSLIAIQFNGTQPQIRRIPIPIFQAMQRLSGSLNEIETAIAQLDNTRSIWLEIHYTGDTLQADLRETLNKMLDGTNHQILKIRQNTQREHLLQQENNETLADLDVHQVFQRCLNAYEISETQQGCLKNLYAEILHEMEHHDPCA